MTLVIKQVVLTLFGEIECIGNDFMIFWEPNRREPMETRNMTSLCVSFVLVHGNKTQSWFSFLEPETHTDPVPGTRNS